MKRLSIIILLYLLASPPIFSQSPNANGAQPATSEQQQLIDLSEQWMNALERQDRAALERFLADDYYISAPGELTKVGRSEWLKNAVELKWDSLKYHNFKIDIYGDTAVVTALLDFRVTNRWGIPISSNCQTIDVWAKRNGQWQVAARHLGQYSIANKLRVAVGFIIGLALCFLVWLFLKLRRRGKAGRVTA